MPKSVHDVSRGGKCARRLGLLVVVLVFVLLAGGLAVILNLSYQKGTTSAPAVQATSTPAPVRGKTLYTTPTSRFGFSSLSWSPNSQRVASISHGVQFWDATTGDHLVTLQFPDDADEWAYTLDWSPNSENVAVATRKQVLIVNGQTGKVISSYTSNVPTANSQTLFSRLSAAADGSGYRGVAWSPDGHLIASARSFGRYGEVQVWDPQTSATNFTLSMDTSYNVATLAWSSDGRYIAGTSWNTQPTDFDSPGNSKVVVWDVSTRQIVFQHGPSMGSDVPVAWQPQSHNLTFGSSTPSGDKIVATLGTWNVTTGNLVKQYVGAGTYGLAWSPDGTYLAYAGSKEDVYAGSKDTLHAVIIMDAVTGKQIYAYGGHSQSVSAIAWSPDGKYIVSGEGYGGMESQAVAMVWTA